MKFGQWWEIREAGTNMLKSAEDQSYARSEGTQRNLTESVTPKG